MSEDGQLELARKTLEQELKIRSALKLVLDETAFQRLSLMKVSNESLYGQIVAYLFQLYNAGKINGRVNEEQLKRIASLFISQRKEGKIVRMSK